MPAAKQLLEEEGRDVCRDARAAVENRLNAVEELLGDERRMDALKELARLVDFDEAM